jgi:hypothetical protein
MLFNQSASQNIPLSPRAETTNYQSYLLMLTSLGVVGFLLCKLRIISKPLVSKFFKSTPGREDPAAFDPFEDMAKAYDVERNKPRPWY